MNNIDDIQKKIRDVHLSVQEREEMRNRIKAFVLQKSAVQPQAKQHLSWFSIFTMNRMVGAFVVVLIFGISFGAHSSLPGDSLYAVKTGVNENVQRVLSLSSYSKARFEKDILQKRIEEINTLTAQHVLDEDEKSVLAKELDVQARRTYDSVVLLASRDPEDAFLVAQDVESVFLAYVGSDTSSKSMMMKASIEPVQESATFSIMATNFAVSDMPQDSIQAVIDMYMRDIQQLRSDLNQ